MRADIQSRDFGAIPQGMVLLRPGDVVDVLGDVHMVVRASESNATVAARAAKSRTVTDRVSGETATFQLPPARHIISTTLPRELVLARQGAAGLHHFLKTRTVQGHEVTNETKATEQGDSMPAKRKTKKTETTAPGAATKGSLGGVEIDGVQYSTTSVINRLGMANVTVPHAKAIMKALKTSPNDTTVQIQISRGKNGKGTPAQLNKEQVEKLKALAEDPSAKEKK
jgi:hypothetical protein